MEKSKEKNIQHILDEFFLIISHSESPDWAVRDISAIAKKYFGEYITPGSLNIKDEKLINLIELLDQIIFEINEETNNNHIREYILEDIYTRFVILLEAIYDIEKYKKNLKNRPLYYEDTIIIRENCLSEFIQLLIPEYEDIGNIQKNILKTLIYFTDNIHLDFFYNIFKNASSPFIRGASLLGLKYCENRGLNWNSLKELSQELHPLIEYAATFNTNNLSSNKLPQSREEMVFAALHAEKNKSLKNKKEEIEWLMNLCKSMTDLNFENSCLNETNISLCNSIMSMDIAALEDSLKNEENLSSLIKYLDYLPRNLFNRLSGIIDSMNESIIFKIENLIENKNPSKDLHNSNVLTYLSYKAMELL